LAIGDCGKRQSATAMAMAMGNGQWAMGRWGLSPWPYQLPACSAGHLIGFF
jgi:hypothetical protein